MRHNRKTFSTLLLITFTIHYSLFADHVKHEVQNMNEGTVLAIHETGDLVLKGILYQNVAEFNTTNTMSYWFLEDLNENILSAFEIDDFSSGFNTIGNLKISGSLTTGTTITDPVSPTYYIFEQTNEEGTRIVAIDTSGNLFLAGDLYQNLDDPKLYRPFVENNGTEGISYHAATIKGLITDPGATNPTGYFYWGDNDGGSNPTQWDYAYNIGVQTGAYQLNLPSVMLEQGTTYYYRSYASNTVGEMWASDTVSFSTLPYLPPVVDAGSNLSTTYTLGLAEVVLNATTSDDGKPDPPGEYELSWEKQSGPGLVLFTDDTDEDSTASFSANGTYILKLTADDGMFQVSDTVQVTVNQDRLWSTFLGSDGNEYAHSIVSDSYGNIYVAGEVYDADFPTSGAYDSSYNGNSDIFITKFSSKGALLWSTYFGGTDDDIVPALAVDNSGNLYLSGCTASDDSTEGFPTTSGVHEENYLGGVYDSFIAKFTSSGSLSWCTYLGGSGIDCGQYIALASDGDLIVTGETSTPNLDTAGAYSSEYNGAQTGPNKTDGYIAKMNSDGSGLDWFTYGPATINDDSIKGIDIDVSGNIYLATWSDISSYTAPNEDGDAGVLVLNSTGTSGDWYNYDKSGYQRPGGIVVDSAGNIYLSGQTDSDNVFPSGSVLSGGEYNDDLDGFLLKLDSDGDEVWSRYIGTDDEDRIYWIDLDNQDHLHLIGKQQIGSSSNYASWYLQYNLDGNSIQENTFGTAGASQGQAIHITADQHALLAGFTDSSTYPVTTGAYDTTHNSGNDVFITKMQVNGNIGEVIIDGPDSLVLDTTNTLTASVESALEGGTFNWHLMLGESSGLRILDGVDEVTTATGSSATIKGNSINSAMVQVSYITPEDDFGSTQTLYGYKLMNVLPKVVYVSKLGDNSDGSSWDKAYTSIQSGINAAATDHMVWVSSGTYQVTSPITMKSDLKLYGSFEGTEIAIDQRNDILGNFSIIEQTSAGQPVLTYGSGVKDTILDSFKITGGNNSSAHGGGIRMSNTGSNNQLFTMDISDNITSGSYNGGGVAIENSIADFFNTGIVANRSGYQSGGGMYIDGSTVTLTTSKLVLNQAPIKGGGLQIQSGSQVTLTGICSANNELTNTTSSTHGGGGINIESTDTATTISKSWISGNRLTLDTSSGQGRGAGLHAGAGTYLNLTNSILSGNGIEGTSSSDWSHLGAGLALDGDSTSSHTVINCTVSDNYSSSTSSNKVGGIWVNAADLNNKPEISNTIVTDNSGYGLNDGSEVTESNNLYFENGVNGSNVGDPQFLMDEDQVSTWSAFTANTYTFSETGQTYSLLTDASAEYTTDSLYGWFIRPNVTHGIQLFITSNTLTSITVVGDVSDFDVTTGTQYQLIDYHLEQ